MKFSNIPNNDIVENMKNARKVTEKVIRRAATIRPVEAII